MNNSANIFTNFKRYKLEFKLIYYEIFIIKISRFINGNRPFNLTLLAASREEPLVRRSQSSIHKLSQLCSLTPPQAAGNALAGFITGIKVSLNNPA